MPFFNHINEIKQYINVSRNLDIKLLQPYESVALKKINEFIPSTLFTEIESSHNKSFELIKQATANYMVAFAIPFIKIHLSNTGGNNFEDDKMKKADWWDIRDFGLSAVRIADGALSEAISNLLQTTLKQQLRLYSNDSIFKTPEEFNEIYTIGNSWDVLKKLQPQIVYVWRVFLEQRLKSCTIENLLSNKKTTELLKSIVGYYTIGEVVSDSTFLFTTSGIVLQWEELPWQKSKVVEPKHLTLIGKKYTKKANELFDLLIAYLKENKADFPCFEIGSVLPIRKTIKKKSGLYL